jgi:crotonobetainyl-CoA:carnitine CoA-transferase CaiB-like acyl-CoA transferase
VIELGTLIAAPFATRMLADFGAEVIKVEAPKTGDQLRKWRKTHEGTSLWWYLQSRNKKSVAIDLKSPEGQQIVRQLAASADVVVENFRPGTLEKWGIGWDELSKINPKLVLVRISGFGQSGPYRDRPGFGAVAEAMGGMRYVTGSPDRPPARAGISIGDSLASLHAVVGALMCLLRVKSGQGEGQIVDVSLLESVFNMMESLVPEYDFFGEIRERSGGTLPGITPSNTYRTRDNSWVVVAGNGDAIFRRLMVAIGRADLAQDSRLQSNQGRVAHERMIDDAISFWISDRDLTTVLGTLDKAEVPASPIYSAKDIMGDPQLQARDMFLDSQLPDGSVVKLPGVVPKLSHTPGRMEWIGPKLGQHTDEVLQAAGYSAEDTTKLRAAGVVE